MWRAGDRSDLELTKPKPCTSLHWRHNGRDSVSNHQPHDCLLNRLFRRRSKKTSKLRVTGLCGGEFPAQMASYAENVSIWWRHHGQNPALAGKPWVMCCECCVKTSIVITLQPLRMCIAQISTSAWDFRNLILPLILCVSVPCDTRDMFSVLDEDDLTNLAMMTSSNANIFRVTGPLCREFTCPGEFPTQRPVTRSFDVFFQLCLNKRLSKQPWGWWFETPSWSLWRQCNVSKAIFSLTLSIVWCLCSQQQ